MDIATRGLTFWTYQTSQEIGYQALVVRNLQEKVEDLEQQLQAEKSAHSKTSKKAAGFHSELEIANRRLRDLQTQLKVYESDIKHNRVNPGHHKKLGMGTAPYVGRLPDIQGRKPFSRPQNAKESLEHQPPQPFLPTPHVKSRYASLSYANLAGHKTMPTSHARSLSTDHKISECHVPYHGADEMSRRVPETVGHNGVPSDGGSREHRRAAMPERGGSKLAQRRAGEEVQQ